MRRWECVLSLMILALVAGVGTRFAISAYPLWDDGAQDLIYLDGGPEGIDRAFVHRPLVGTILNWQFVDPSWFYYKAAAVHWFVCFSTGWFSLYIARHLFPERPALALSTACLATSPFLCPVQIVLARYPVVTGLSLVTAFLATFLIAGTLGNRLPVWNLASRWVAASALLIVGGLLTEYFVASTLAGIVWILFLGTAGDKSARARSYQSALALLLLTVGIYLFFHYQLSSAEAHPRNRPEYLVASRDGWRVFVRLCNWTTAVYEACLGTLLERTGSLRLETYTDVASLGFGALLAILIQLLVGRRNDESQPEGAESFQRRLVVGLIMGVGLGMLPIVVMGFRPDVNPFESRFWAPVAPYAVCASVALVAQLFSNQKQWLLPPLCAILAAWALVSDGIPAAKELQRVSAWGPQLQKYVDADVNEDAMCVAIFENGWPHGALLPNDYELTPRLARDWPPAQRARFWAFASYDKMMEREFTSGIDPDHSLHSPRLDREYMYRVGPIHRVLWVYVSSDGDLQVTKVDTVEEQAL